MIEYKEVKISRILNPTGIDLGEYVINPFMGCEYSCLYCYVRSNRVISRRPGEWGTYVDIRINAPELKNKLEPKSPGFELRIKAINKMLDENIAVVPYFSPILPWVSDFKDIFSRFPKSDSVEFEGLNINLMNINDIISGISSLYPVLRPEYEKLLKDRTFYDSFWVSVKKDIIREAIKAKKNYNIYPHNFRAYFNNKYAG